MSVISGPSDYYQGADRVYYYQTLHPELYQHSMMTEKPKKKRRWEPCTCIMSTLFIILIILIVGAIVLFFTLGSLLGPPLATDEQQTLAISTPKQVKTHTDSVTAEWLKSVLPIGCPKFCTFDTAYWAENHTDFYNKEHIPSAQHFDINSVKTDSETHVRMSVHPFVFEDYLQSRGVDQSSHVMLYNHGESNHSIMSTTFAFWLLKVYGFSKVSIVNGGLAGWKEKNFETSNATVTVEKRGKFKSAWDSNVVASYSDVLANFDTEKYLLVDTRPEEYFNGKKKSKNAKSKGKIKGSISLPYTDLLEDNGELKSYGQLRRILAKNGIIGQKPVIVTCETGITATILYYVLRQANIEAKVYSGSWVEWSHLSPEELKA